MFYFSLLIVADRFVLIYCSDTSYSTIFLSLGVIRDIIRSFVFHIVLLILFHDSVVLRDFFFYIFMSTQFILFHNLKKFFHRYFFWKIKRTLFR